MNRPYFLTINLNPTLQKTLVFPEFRENEVNRCVEHHLDVSGKGINVTRVLCQLDEPVRHLTCAGGRERDLFLAMCSADGLDVQWVESNAEIRYCYTIVNMEGRTVTELVEEGRQVEAAAEDLVVRKFDDLLEGCHSVIISGTKAPGFSGRLYPRIVKRAKDAGKLVILDLKGDDLTGSLPYRPDVIKPNFAEFVSTFSAELGSPGDRFVSEHEADETLVEAVSGRMCSLHERYGCIVVLTRGGRGVLFTEGGSVRTLAVDTVHPVNSIGSGDAFTAGFASEYLRSKNTAAAAARGAECGRLNALQLRPGVIR